jgi:hypothetical protein
LCFFLLSETKDHSKCSAEGQSVSIYCARNPVNVPEQHTTLDWVQLSKLQQVLLNKNGNNLANSAFTSLHVRSSSQWQPYELLLQQM